MDPNMPELPHPIQLMLFRIAQEVLGNLRRHSRASKARIRLEFTASVVRLTIADNGVGFTVPSSLSEIASSGHLGVLGMQERAQLLGGSLTLTSALDKGTTVVAEVPCKL